MGAVGCVWFGAKRINYEIEILIVRSKDSQGFRLLKFRGRSGFAWPHGWRLGNYLSRRAVNLTDDW